MGETKTGQTVSAPFHFLKCAVNGRSYLSGLGEKKPMARSREVRRPEGASRIAGMELTATEAVAMSPWEPPGMTRLIFG